MALIEVRSLTKLYRMGDSVVHALDGVDLTIERGEFVAITGASGSGKSTMMHLLGCLDRPTDGTYTFAGRDVSDLSDADLAAVRNGQIGFVFQTFNLINRTSATENVAVPLFYARRTGTRAPSLRALERVGLTQRAHHNPNELSGGERQRVAIARAIVNDPLLVLADEPTGNLDSRTGEQIMGIFHDLNAQGVTIVMVTHEPEIARQAKRIVQMRDGKIVFDRPTAELVAAEGTAPTAPPVIPSRPPAPAAADSASAAVGSAGHGTPTPSPTDAAVAETPNRLKVTRAQRLPRANASFVLAIASLAVWGVAFGIGWWMQAAFDLKAIAAGGGKQPPAGLVAGGVGACAAYVTAPTLAIIALVLAVRARRHARTEPGLWRGQRRALAGLWLGIVSLAVPLVAFAVSRFT